MKLNNKGFMMAEVVVVSAVVLVTLTALYLSYNKLYSAYSTRLTYNDITTLYRLSYYRDYLLGKKDSTGNRSILSLIMEKVAMDNDTIFIINSEDDNNEYIDSVDILCNDASNNCKENVVMMRKTSEKMELTGVNPTYSQFVSYISDSKDIANNAYVLLMEKCDVIDSETTNCKYAYLDI